jgi:potassium-transporting ATPase KdpC subunit
MSTAWSGLRLLILMTLLTGLLYPLFVTGVAQLIMPQKAQGSLIQGKGGVIGSALVGQQFIAERYFWSRPSAVDYQTVPSGGSNLGPTSPVLRTQVEKRKAFLLQAHPTSSEGGIPPDLLFTSASGIDPHISVQAAYFQVERIAKTRGFTADIQQKLLAFIDQQAKPSWPFFKKQYVNVLLLNCALDELFTEGSP